ncbi:trypsin-like peptidase domain-containing protein [Chitinimonas koreensis]|uniref:trypsin-like peptidase domain-containing protein n=1 Tax=Chitinimonas koreensis TaxID=356302 RepID=UPI001653F8F7|nr:trypsin-like peptidase domain-containing protein [Chitinimonas koreensis]QNM96297.1 trypsin-like peptidase domain-containing protein [Chitinimonas koreensis]
MKKLWLIFAQTTTVGLALWFLLTLLKPAWLPKPMAEVVTLTQALPTAPAPLLGQTSYSGAVRHAMPSVVNIYTSKEIKQKRHPLLDDPLFRRFFGDRFEGNDNQRTSSLGSGVIVSTQGYIVTNNHVVASADEIEVALSDGRSVSAVVVGTDPDTDLAVIKIELDKLPAITFGQVDKLNVGDVVLAIGNPFGVGQTVTMGIVSALGRTGFGINTFENFIQTDAAINPGNSGGALVDAQGNLVGINSAIYSRTGGSMGIGFAIPSSTVKTVMEEIIKDGAVTRGWIGVETQDLTPELAASFGLSKPAGVLINGVVRGGPADRAGLKPGDVLIAVARTPVADFSSMLNAVAGQPPAPRPRST